MLGLVDESNEYSDEYNDSYDALGDSEAKTVRIRGAAYVVVDDLESDEEEEAQQQHQRSDPSRDSTKDFCGNPVVQRAWYEQQRQFKYRARDGWKSRDVTGKPKGQNQDDKTKQDLKKKNANKASDANHSYRKGSHVEEALKALFYLFILYQLLLHYFIQLLINESGTTI